MDETDESGDDDMDEMFLCFLISSGCGGNWSCEQLTDCFSESEKYRCHFISNYIENREIFTINS